MIDSLVYTSNGFALDIDQYESNSFIWQGWIIKDSYTEPNKTNHGCYKLIVCSHLLQSPQELAKVALEGQSLVRILTVLMKYVTLLSLNVDKRSTASFSRKLILPSDIMDGWSSNYWDVDESLKKKFRGPYDELTVESVSYSTHDKSPLNELKIVLNSYRKLDPMVYDLMELYAHVDVVDSAVKYMLMGKVLEIVDSLYPKEGNNDNRIEKLFPELAECFKGMTIHKLMGLANTRKEGRHYYDKKTQSPHKSMTEDELVDYYQSIDLLVVNIVRKALGLDIVYVDRDN